MLTLTETCRAACQGRSAHVDGRRVPGAARRDGRVLRAARRRSRSGVDWRFANTTTRALPATRCRRPPPALCVALADKLETLVGLFGVGEKPTGEKDPFALRRHALGILRMLMEKQLAIPLDRIAAHRRAGVRRRRCVQEPDADLLEFVYERLRGLLREEGYSAQQVEAVITLQPMRIDQVPQQLAAVRAFMALPEAESLAAANKRIGNILKKADDVPVVFDRALLLEPAERSLGEAFSAVRPWAEQLYASGDYSAMLKSLAPLKLPVDRFFDEVMVNVDDAKLRANRLGLLAALRTTMNRVADISKLQ